MQVAKKGKFRRKKDEIVGSDLNFEILAPFPEKRK